MTHPTRRVLQMRLVVEADDYDEAVRFYRDVLGAGQELQVHGEAGENVTILEVGRATLELSNPAQVAMIDRVEVGRPVSPRLRVAFEVADAEGATQDLVDAGAELVAPPTRTPWDSLNARLQAPGDLQITLFQELAGARRVVAQPGSTVHVVCVRRGRARTPCNGWMTATQDLQRPSTGSSGGPPTLEERAALGRGVRATVPRSVHGEWAPAADRPDPVSLLEEQAASRVPELVPLRYARMLVSPFTFYRGAAYLMASDLAAVPRTGLTAQLCGDAHLSNFGTYAAPDRRLVFSLNDFDESLPGPFEWDVKRLAASFAVAGRDRGFDDAQRERVNRAVGESYRQSIAELAGMRRLDVWYSRLDVDQTRGRRRGPDEAAAR